MHEMNQSEGPRVNKSQTTPHCLKCGSTEIGFRYWDYRQGGTINEAGALSMACSLINELIDERFANNVDPEQLATAAHTLWELSVMWRVRVPEESEEAQS